MRSPESTYYNVKRLHVVFAVSSLALLAVTVWMVAADHWREWKVYQRTFRDRVEPWLTEAWIRERQTEQYTVAEEQLKEALAKAREAVPDRDLIEGFCEELDGEASRRGVERAGVAQIEAAYEALLTQPGVEARETLLARLSKHATTARNRRENADRQLRFRRADFDEARSLYEAGVGEGLSDPQLARLQERVDRVKREVDALAVRSEEVSAHYEALSGLLGEITRQEDDARQALADHRAAVDRLDRALAEQRPNFGKRLLRLPLVDAFGRPLAIDQIWLPELTIDYHFRRVARFDRCVTCHQGIDKTASGSPSEPACPGEEVFTIELAIPVKPVIEGREEVLAANAERSTTAPGLEELYGLALAPRGILDRDDATIGLVLPRTPAADAGLLAGDVIVKIDDLKMGSGAHARQFLTQQADHQSSAENAAAGALKLEIRRGLSRPYCSHPRLDLFVGSLSPHPLSQFGCTICHGGQGSATAFKFASHTPNDPAERVRWRKQYGWFWNHDWDLPMRPARFVEASCLRCHHAVTDLAPSTRFPDPPAPKLLAGYHLVRQHGCFGCHEIKGVTGPGERVGPDMRLEPKYHEAALDLLAGTDLTEEQQLLARQVVQRPETPEPRRQLAASLASGSGQSAVVSGQWAGAMKVLAAEEAVPGSVRKVGPTLRNVAGKLDAVFIETWLRDPPGFRPGTRMPQLYGMHEHLDGKSLADARRFEAVEIHAVAEYLLALSQPVEPLQPPPEVTEEPSAQRGKRLFLTQGCLACHRHKDFPEGQASFAADLSNLGSKLKTDAGATWLASWVRNPARHSPRTLMPNVLLEPTPLAESGENGDGRAEEGEQLPPRPMTDPAADIAAYLTRPAAASKATLSRSRESVATKSPGEGSRSSPAPPKPKTRPPLVEADLDELALSHLAGAISRRRAEQYLKGTVALTADRAQGDSIELLPPVTLEKRIRYVGRATIRKRGCYGCHDVPGFEDAQPIGPALSDWGRKQESLLAFEQVHQFVAKGSGQSADQQSAISNQQSPDFYAEALLAKRREGFLWQKLRAPRSFDYKKTENKGYNEQLTMGRFSFSPDQREAIITFVLGLVADPPAEKYVYRGDRRSQAIVEGRKVLDQYACAECHTLEMERWQVQYDPEEIEEPYAVEDFPFLQPQVDAQALEASTQPDRRGLLHAEAVGMPQVDERGKMLDDVDDDDHPTFYFNLWQPLALKVQDAWMPWRVGGAQLGVSDPREVAARPPDRAFSPMPVEQQRVRPTCQPHLVARREPVGGAFTRLLFPRVLDEDNPALMEAWGWVSPPLVGEGLKTQPAWLHDYLLEPFAIRPAAVLRMPKYTLSPEEAGKLVDYFAAVAGVDFPYSSDPRSRSAGLEAKEIERPNRLDDAMRIVIDRTTYCTKCHLVGDYSPGGETKTVLAPRLDRVGRRIRPEYLRRWLARPKSLLPYTGMPVNFPPAGPPLGQEVFEGSSAEQLDAATDLLLNYDWYMNRRASIREMIESAGQAKSP